ncbi:anti-sigma regulatory factor (Ser/Thr protein kinase) [Streptomyces sp. Ag109_O5-1]|uniref:ATP-binding protein n=1 Tax=Streptomyces sp. Ag109_O5-1 TaxID=1938851 RepID=UPI000F4FA444|nr:ATP-binding protein [Streptomyces sp. Ag109_O5-1]RPE41233.1 anti-sigma regulatory factor (Ser/Thr protein kinase) [Streptomyces sp. Ag109_O5-1]
MATVVPRDTWVYALRLPHDPRAARMPVRSVLDSHGRSEVLDAVQLLTSELVTNAYLHAGGPVSLRLTALADGRLRVGVWGGHPRVPAPFGEPPGDRVPPAPAGAQGGRGRCLVQEYAPRWGGWSLESGPLDRGAGKLLWFEAGL